MPGEAQNANARSLTAGAFSEEISAFADFMVNSAISKGTVK